MGKESAALIHGDPGSRLRTCASAACVGDVVRLVGLSRHDLNGKVGVEIRSIINLKAEGLGSTGFPKVATLGELR